jgi:hypothetical protein
MYSTKMPESLEAFLEGRADPIDHEHPEHDCICGHCMGERCHCPPQKTAHDEWDATRETVFEVAHAQTCGYHRGSDCDCFVSASPKMADESEAIEAEHRTGDVYETVASMLADDGHLTVKREHGADTRAAPWEHRQAASHPLLAAGYGDVKQSGAKRTDPNDPRLCRHPNWVRDEILSLVEEACQQAVKEATAPRPYSENVTKADLVSVYLKDGEPHVLMVPAGGGRMIEARMCPALLGSLIAGLGAMAGALLATK